MTKSLKSMFPALGRILDMTPDQLYASQRAFVAAGILDSTPGRGPGSGVRAGPDTVAQFLIGLINNASTVENVPLARSLGNARGECRLTGAKRFKDALAGILASEALAGRINEVMIGLTICQAFIRYDGPIFKSLPSPEEHAAQRAAHPHKSSVFVGTPKAQSPLVFNATIPHVTLVHLARAIAQADGAK
jgi:hypothetical protein